MVRQPQHGTAIPALIEMVVRAEGPVSLQHIQSWLLEQCLEYEQANELDRDYKIETALDRLIAIGRVSLWIDEDRVCFNIGPK